MSIELVVIGLALAVLAASVIWHAIDVVWARRLVTRRRVLVSLRTGQALDGVLWARRGRLLVLKRARLVELGAEPVSMDGDVIVDRDVVEFIQVAGEDR